MNTDLASQLVTARMDATHNAVQIAVFKKAHEMQTDLLTTLLDSAKAPLAAGQGTQIDRSA